MNKKLLELLEFKRQQAYNDPKSIQKELDVFLESNGVYRSFNEDIFMKKIKGKSHLCNYTLSLYFKATLDNEKVLLLRCLLEMGYSENAIIEMVLNIFQLEKENENLWNYADFLYRLKNYSYLDDYVKLIMDQTLGTNREMIILLVGESKALSVIPYLLELAQDDEILGHVLIALTNFKDSRIITLMKKHTDHQKKWVADIAQNYLTTY